MADALARLARMSPWWAKAWFQGIRGGAGASRRLNLRLDTAGVVGVRRRKAREIGGGNSDADGGVGAFDGASWGAGFPGPRLCDVCHMIDERCHGT